MMHVIRAAFATLLIAHGHPAAADPDPDPEALGRWLAAPWIAADGKAIIVPQVDQDVGARGLDGFRFVVYDRRGVAVEQAIEAPAGEALDPKTQATRDVAALKMLASYDTTRHMMRMAQAEQDNNPERVRIAAGKLVVTIGPSGTLTVSPPHAASITRSSAKWAMQRKLSCSNPARLGALWFDITRNAVVVRITFDGTDTCPEPASEYAVVTW